MKAWSLQTRLIVLILIPTTLLVLGLGVSVVLARFHGLESVQDERGHILLAKYRFAFDQIREVTPASLQDLAVAALEETGVRSLSLLDREGRTILHSGPLSHPLERNQTLELDEDIHRYVTADSWLYVQRLGSAVPTSNGQLKQAWVMLEFSTSELTIRKYESLLLVLALCLAALALLTTVLIRQVHRWLAPVADMTTTLQQVDSEHLDRRLYTEASGDLQDLEN